nr:hypothetical protein Iba_chr02cCG14380 [Ipomoea batatas]
MWFDPGLQRTVTYHTSMKNHAHLMSRSTKPLYTQGRLTESESFLKIKT